MKYYKQKSARKESTSAIASGFMNISVIAGNISQVLILGLAIFGYFYTGSQ
jgi:hypothetical protein